MTTTEVWGTGYGDKRHLTDLDSFRESMATGRPRARAQCSSMIYLDKFDDRGEADRKVIAKRKPCKRCEKKAGQG